MKDDNLLPDQLTPRVCLSNNCEFSFLNSQYKRLTWNKYKRLTWNKYLLLLYEYWDLQITNASNKNRPTFIEKKNIV